MKKLLATILATTMLVGSVTSAFAINTNPPREHTQEEIQQIQRNNEKIDKEFNALRIKAQLSGKKFADAENIPPIMRAVDRNKLRVKVREQEKNYYCSVACMQMVIEYLDNRYVSQKTLASKTGLERLKKDGISADAIEYWLNIYLGSNTYEHVTIDEVNMANSIVIGIEHNKPTICQTHTRKLPNYSFRSGHYVLAVGYDSGFSGSSSINDVTYIDPFDNDHGSLGYNTWSMSEMESAINANPSNFIVRPVI